MKIIHKTLVTNKLNTGRTYRFFGKRGLYLGPKESKIVDGIYPSACRNPGSIVDLENTIAAGHIEIEIITNLPVRRPIGDVDSIQIPAAVKEHGEEVPLHVREGIELNTVEGGLHEFRKPSEDPESPITKVEVRSQDAIDETTQDARWKQQSIEEQRDKDVVMLAGHEKDTEIPKPKTKEIFKDAADPAISPEAYDPDAQREAMAETLAEAEKADAISRGDLAPEEATTEVATEETTEVAEENSTRVEKSEETPAPEAEAAPAATKTEEPAAETKPAPSNTTKKKTTKKKTTKKTAGNKRRKRTK
jgi:hypothetical protein